MRAGLRLDMGYVAKKLALILATGYILLFFSELLFWARFDPDGKGFGDRLLTRLAYSALGFVVLSVIEVCRVRTL